MSPPLNSPVEYFSLSPSILFDSLSPTGCDQRTSRVPEDSPKAPRDVVIVDPEGDLIIEVTGEENANETVSKRFLISSTVLINTSDYFQGMLGPGSMFAERETLQSSAEKGKGVGVIPMQDDPDAAEVFFQILHGNRDEIPLDLPIRDIASIAVFTDKHNLMERLKPWAHHWMSAHSEHQSSSQNAEELVKALEVYSVFLTRDRDYARALFNDAVRSVRLKGENLYVGSSRTKFYLTPIISSKLTGTLKALRIAAVKQR